MQSEQAYLDSEITLPKLAALAECPVNHLSQVINSGFNMSFFDYLNQYRIEDAKKLLALEDGQLQAILSIAVNFPRCRPIAQFLPRVFPT